MLTRTFTQGRIRRADYDNATRQLELHFEGGTLRAYKHVPNEVFRRLCNAPNPTTYWEDRIAEEYPKGTPSGAGSSGGKDWSDLFGADGDDGSGKRSGD